MIIFSYKVVTSLLHGAGLQKNSTKLLETFCRHAGGKVFFPTNSRTRVPGRRSGKNLADHVAVIGRGQAKHTVSQITTVLKCVLEIKVCP